MRKASRNAAGAIWAIGEFSCILPLRTGPGVSVPWRMAKTVRRAHVMSSPATDDDEGVFRFNLDRGQRAVGRVFDKEQEERTGALDSGFPLRLG